MLVLVVIVVGFVGIVLLNKDKAGAPSSSNSTAQVSNHLLGNNSKGVTLIEYGDYQCPACSAYYPLVKQLVDKYKDDIHFQFSNFPLSSIHQNAFASARAAEAADKQGKFWEMHDLLYEKQQDWSTSNNAKSLFQGYASQLGLDITKFDTDYSSNEVNDVINADIKAAQAIGADSTPTFVLEGKKIEDNPKDQASFDKLIADAIAAKTKQ